MIYIWTYGCTFNTSDSQTMRHFLHDELTDDLERADIVIFNTCGVKGQTEHRVLRDIAGVMGTKKVIVAGCLPLINGGAIPSGVDAVIGPDQIPQIRDIVARVRAGGKVRDTSPSHAEPVLLPREGEPPVGIVPISLGCKGSCTYCATRFARGRLRSYAPEDILRTVSHLIEEGYREIELTSQDTGCYGADIGTSLHLLLSSLAALPGDFRIRVGMMNPNHVLDDLDDLVSCFENEKLYSFVHLPVQAGSDRVLRDMNRHYTSAEFLDIVDAFRTRIPDLYLATDIIVGFPGESEGEFAESCDLIRACRPDKVNVTRYSARPGTPAAGMKQFPDRIKKDRSRILTKLVHQLSWDINQAYVGREVRALVTQEGKKGRRIGRLDNYKPIVVDGPLGSFVTCRVVKATSTYLVGASPTRDEQHHREHDEGA